MFDIEIKWNREFHWSHYTSKNSQEDAISFANAMMNSGDGARVKGARILFEGSVIWCNGKATRKVES